MTRHRFPQRDSFRARSRPATIPVCCLFLLNLTSGTTQSASQSTSSHYTNGPHTTDFGGGSSTSPTYSQTASITEITGINTQSGSEPDAIADLANRTAYVGQLYEITSLLLTANPAALDEGQDSQLAAKAVFDDASLLPLNATAVTWSVVSGPLFGISVTGLTTAENISQNQTAIIRGTYAGAEGTLTITVVDSIPDNYGTYAGDGIHDGWQTTHFGSNPTQGGMNDDPDHDGVSNFLEYAFGMTPTQSDAGFLSYSGTSLTHPGLPTTWMQPTPSGVDLRALFIRRTAPPVPALRYTVQFSADLVSWQNSTAVPDTRAVGANVEAVSVRYPLFLNNGRKARFFRVQVETVNPAP